MPMEIFEGRGSGGEVGAVQSGVGEGEIGERETLGDGEGGDGNEDEDQGAEGGVEDFVEFVEFFFRIELGEDREGGDADGLADQAERNAHQSFAPGEPGDGAGVEVGTEGADDPVVDEREGEREHDGDGEFQKHPEAGMADVEVGREFAPARCAP